MGKLDDVLRGLDGDVVTAPGGESSTLKQLVEHAILNPGQVLSEAENLRLWGLAKAVHLTGEVPEEAKALVRAAVSRLYGPLAVGQICEALDTPAAPPEPVRDEVGPTPPPQA